jgi:Bacterial Ig-like domain (group 3)
VRAAKLSAALVLAIGASFALPTLAGATGPASMSPTTLAFGNVPLGSSPTLPIQLHFDTGYSLASLSSSDGAFSPPWHLDTSGCSATSDADCAIQITFDATSLGAHTAHFDAFECPIAGGSCIGIGSETLSATTVSVASLDPTTLAFGDVALGTSKTLPIAVTLDSGYSLASLSSGDGAFSPPWTLDTSSCSASSDAPCTIHETFTAAALGAKTAHFDAFECPIAGGSCLKIGSETLTATGVQIATTTTLASSANPSRVNAPVTFTATVTPASGSAAATGNVTFADGSTTLATVALSAGVATFTTSTLGLGPHTITATYGGDTEHSGSSATLTQTIRRATSTTTLASSENPSLAGHAVTLTATVTGETGSAAPTGSVTFTEGATTLATVALSSGGAAFTTSTLTTGSHTITATYGGDAEHTGSSATVTQVVQDAATLLAILQADVSGIGSGSSLLSKVQDATAYFNAGDIADACHTLDDFIRQVRAQSGKKLTPTQAARLIAEAQRTELALGC